MSEVGCIAVRSHTHQKILAVTVPMYDHHGAVQPRRHHADNHVTVPTNHGFQIGILGEGFLCQRAPVNTPGRLSKPTPPHRGRVCLKAD